MLAQQTLGVLAIAAAWCQPVAAASLRPMVTLSDAVVRLSDLFDDAGPQAARVLGPGPAPGTRIVVESAQLAAIARQFGVDWRPASTGDRSVLDRPGRTLRRQDVMVALRAALEGVGYAAECDIELPGFNPPLVPLGGDTQVSIEQLDHDAASGSFSAIIDVMSEGLPPQRMRVVGRVQDTVEVPVATRRLLPGTLLRPEDLRLVRLRTGLIQTEIARSEEEAVNHVVRHLSMPGQPFALADLARPAVVERGARVTMRLQSDGIELTASGVASESGGLGDQIGIRNPLSGVIVQAEVTGPGSVRVAPGSVPVAPSRRAAAPVVAIR